MTYRMACEAADVIAAAAPVDFRCVTGKDPLATTVSATTGPTRRLERITLRVRILRSNTTVSTPAAFQRASR